MEPKSITFTKRYKRMLDTARRLAEKAGDPLIQRTHLWRAIVVQTPRLFEKLLGVHCLNYGEWLKLTMSQGKASDGEGVYLSSQAYRILSLSNGGGLAKILAETKDDTVDLPHVAAALILDNQLHSPIRELLLVNGIDVDSCSTSVIKRLQRMRCRTTAHFERDAIRKVALVRDRLRKSIVGQDQAIESVCGALLEAWRLPLKDRKKPVAIFCCGAQGVGKTELVTCLMAAISEANKLTVPGVTLNASLFATEQTADDLVGHDANWKYSGPGKLTKVVYDTPQRPVCIESAELLHPRSLSLICEAMGGSLRDESLGKDVDFRQSVLIFTTSAGGTAVSCTDEDVSALSTNRQRLSDLLCDGIVSIQECHTLRTLIGNSSAVVAMRQLDANGLRQLTSRLLEQGLSGVKRSYKRIECDKGALADVLVQALPSFDPRAIQPLVSMVTDKLRLQVSGGLGRRRRPRTARITVESGAPFDPDRLTKNLHSRRRLDFHVEAVTQPDRCLLEIRVKSKGYSLLPDIQDGFIHISPPDGGATSFDNLVGVSVVFEAAKCWKAYFDGATQVKPESLAFAGAPGTGKTACARAMARYLQVPFCVLDGKDLTSGADVIVSTFAKIRRYAKVGGMLVFIDEIDSIGKVRDGMNENRAILLTTLLTELDGFYANSHICVICATNRIETLDPALLRAGRFGKTIFFASLCLDERKKLVRMAADEYGIRISAELEAFVVRSTDGVCPSEIKAIMRELALSGSFVPTRDDYIQARQSILEGVCTQSTELTGEEKTAVAVHECGHALVCHLYGRVFTQVSIRTNGVKLGFLEEYVTGFQTHTSEGMLKSIDIALAGRAANEILGYPTDGSISDLQRATSICLKYVKAGFSEYGLAVPDNGVEWKEIAGVVRPILSKRYEHVRTILERERMTLNTLTAMLLERKVLFQDDIQEVCAKSKPGKDVRHV